MLFIKIERFFFYLLHLSLGDGLSLKPRAGPAKAGVSPRPLRRLVCGVREAVEEGHLLSQAKCRQIGLLRDRLLAASLLTESLNWFLDLLFWILNHGAWLRGRLDAGW